MKKIERDIIKFIAEYYAKTLFYPSYLEIAEGIDRYSKGTVNQHMKRLEEMGIIVFKPNSKQYRLNDIDFVIANLGKKSEI